MNTFIFETIRQRVAILAFLLLGVACNDQQPAEVYAPSGKAINGYDPVAFFTESKPVKGTDAFTYQWKDANWYFASQQNLDAFTAAPQKYTPQYGGYCAYGTAQGHKAPTKPETFTVENGKLYFNYNKTVKKDWDKNRQHLIVKADANWPKVKKQTE